MLLQAKLANATLPPFKRLLAQRDAALAAAAKAEAEIALLRAANDQASTAWVEHERRCFSHFGEDQALLYYFKGRTTGFFVDAGCYHPSLYSNTMALYQLGWRGINIDANAFMIQECQRLRPEDLNLHLAIAPECGQVTFQKFHDWASSNTASAAFADKIGKASDITAEEITVQAAPLSEVFEKHVPPNTTIDLLNVDLEGHDLLALESNDWTRFKPRVILVEELDFDMADPNNSEIFRFLSYRSYKLYSRLIMTNMYVANTEADAAKRFL